MLIELRRAFTMLAVMTLITGVAYPMLVTAIAQAAFHGKANGSLIEQNGHITGSELIGQNFTSDKYFRGRPSATPRCPRRGWPR